MGTLEKQLTPEDKDFIKLYDEGVKPSPAFRTAYPDHKAVKAYNSTQPGTTARQEASEMLANAAKNKLKSQYIQNAMTTYQESMERFSALSVQTAIDLVKNARSEKVRADLAIEGMRHKVGSPTVKVAVQESKVVYLTFGAPPKDERTIIEGEVVQDALDESVGI